MGKTGYGQIGHKFKGGRWNSAEKTASQVSQINTDSIEYVSKMLVKK